MEREEFVKNARSRLHHYCARRERSSKELLDKAIELELQEAEAEKILKEFLELKIIDDARFARMMVRSKFLSNKWGKVKIRMSLRTKGISSQLIEEGLKEIDHDDYLNLIRRLVDNKMPKVKKKGMQKKAHIVSYLRAKGFEDSSVWEIVNEYQFN
jgi:regulatory protein